MVTRHCIVHASSATMAFSMLLTACAATSPPGACLPEEEHSVMETVYFGANIPGGGQVSAEEWQAFLDKIITPRFPGGLTSFKADGQWRNKAGAIESENTYVLQIIHPGSPATAEAIREVASIYQTRYKQEAVLRVRNASCISLNQASG